MEICTSTILMVIVLILSILYLYIKSAKKFFERAGISGPKTNFLFGIFPEYKKKGVHKTDLDLINEHGKLVGIFHGHKPLLLVADPDIIKAICVTHFENFQNRKVSLDLGPLLSRSVALSSNNQWKFLREHISDIFKPRYLEQITENLLQSSKHLISNVEDKFVYENDFDFHQICLSYSVDSLCNSLFGHNINSFKDKNDMTVNMIKRGWFAANGGLVGPAVKCAVCPAMTKWYSLAKFDPVPKDVSKYLSDLIKEKMKQRHNDGGYSDFLAFMMKQCRRKSVVVDSKNNTTTSCGYRLSETEIVANCLFFFLAGYDTTASTIVFTLYCLSKHQHCQEKLVSEIGTKFKTNEITFEEIEDMPYLKMVLNETLRLFPSYLRFGREVNKDTIINGTKFTKGLEVAFPVYAIHMNKEYFPDPTTFDPERFSEDNSAKINPYAYIPFGAGPRDCFGQTYAKLAIKIAVVSLLQKFTFSLSKTQQDPPALSKGGMYLQPEKGLWLSVTKRCQDQHHS